jgi:hypothetical protein
VPVVEVREFGHPPFPRSLTIPQLRLRVGELCVNRGIHAMVDFDSLRLRRWFAMVKGESIRPENGAEWEMVAQAETQSGVLRALADYLLETSRPEPTR